MHVQVVDRVKRGLVKPKHPRPVFHRPLVWMRMLLPGRLGPLRLDTSRVE